MPKKTAVKKPRVSRTREGLCTQREGKRIAKFLKASGWELAVYSPSHLFSAFQDRPEEPRVNAVLEGPPVELILNLTERYELLLGQAGMMADALDAAGVALLTKRFRDLFGKKRKAKP